MSRQANCCPKKGVGIFFQVMGEKFLHYIGIHKKIYALEKARKARIIKALAWGIWSMYA